MNKPTSYQVKALKSRLKIDWTYTSNAIEGNTISLGDTAYIIEYGLTVKGKSLKEHNEVVGHARAGDLIYDFVKKDKFTQDDLFTLHKAIQTNIVIDIECPIGDYKVVENGRYVKLPNKRAEFFPYPHPNNIPYLMKIWFDQFEDMNSCDDFEKCIDIYTDLHISFTAIHPFFDGNGRLARLVANLPILKSGYLPFIISNEDRPKYIDLLSIYNLNTKELDKNSTILIDKNEHYYNLREFFKDQYKNSQELLDTIKGK